MKLRHNLILFICLILVAFVILVVERPFENKAKKTQEEAPFLFPGLEAGQVEKIVVKEGNLTRTLENRDNRWYILDKENFPADSAIVEGVIKKIQGIKKINLASRNEAKHALFEVKKGMGIEVTFWGSDKKELSRLIIGKLGPDFFGNYIRRPDSDDVYLYDDFLGGEFCRQVNGWRDRTIVSFNPDDAVTLTISKPKEKETIALTKDTQGNWQLEEPVSGLAENSLIKKILTTLGNLKAIDFADERELEDSGVDDPARRITVGLKDNRKKTLLVGRVKGQIQYYAKNDEKKYLFLLDQKTVENLTPSVKDLQKSTTGSEKKNPPKKTELPSQ